MAPNTSNSPSNALSDDEIIKQLMQVLGDLKKEGKLITLRICPQCKSPTLRSRETWYDIGGAMGITPPKYRCLKCGYWGRVIIEATNEDITEEVIDDLLGADIENAQKLLNDITRTILEKNNQE
ncbi:MAG: hypothetical protein ACFFBU_03685 [Promethearchaeota archaeon]